MSRTARTFAIFMLLMTIALDARGHAIITRMSDRQVVTLAELAAAAGGSELILVGESHDNKDHHGLQLELIRSLFSQNLPLAIGVEMMEATYQPQLDKWVSGRMSEPAMEALFAQNWTHWEMYRDIFLFARDNRIPMVALNVPQQIVKKVSQHGLASLTEEERKGLPAEMSCDLRNPQIAMLRRWFSGNLSHRGDGKIFNNFCEAQTVRNSGMALRIARYLEKHPERKMVTLTGIWHAEKHAIPEQLERNGRTLSYTVILPESVELGVENSGTSEADYLVDL